MLLDTDQNIVNKQQDKLLKIAQTLKELEDSLKRFCDKKQDNIAALYTYFRKKQDEETVQTIYIMIYLNDFKEVLNRLTDMTIEDYPDYEYHFC